MRLDFHHLVTGTQILLLALCLPLPARFRLRVQKILQQREILQIQRLLPLRFRDILLRTIEGLHSSTLAHSGLLARFGAAFDARLQVGDSGRWFALKQPGQTKKSAWDRSGSHKKSFTAFAAVDRLCPQSHFLSCPAVRAAQ